MSVRLACVRHAASVRSEPGSNSQVCLGHSARSLTRHGASSRAPKRTSLRCSARSVPTHGTAACASLTQLPTQRCQTAGNPEAPSTGASRRGGAGFYTRQSGLSTGLVRPANPAARPCPLAADRRPIAAATRGADQVLSGEEADPTDRPAGRTYINPAPRPFKRPNAGSLQDRRATSSNDLVGGGGPDIGTPAPPCPELFYAFVATPRRGSQSSPKARSSRAISSGISPASPRRSGGAISGAK